MSFTLTANYNLKKIDFDTEENTWGNLLNQNWDSVDTEIANAKPKRLGLIELRLIVPTYAIECDGRTINKVLNPEYTALVDYLRAIGPIFQGVSTDEAIIPDTRGRFPRGVNPTGINNSPMTNIGDVQQDQFQAHKHKSTISVVTNEASAINVGSGASFNAHSLQNLMTGYATDGVNGIPRTGDETRPKSISFFYCIAYR